MRIRSIGLFCSAALLAGCPGDDTSADSTSGGTEDTSAGPTEPTVSTSPSTTATTVMTSAPTTTDPTTDDTATESGGPTTTSIYDIQMGNVPEGSIVTIADVIVTSPVQMNQGGVTVQEAEGGPYSGIYIYMFEDVVGGVSVSPGDVVTITGQYTEFFDFSQIAVNNANNIVVTGTADVPAPEVVAAADIAVGGGMAEAYEGVLVRVEDVTASDATNRFGDFHVDGDLVITNFFLFQENAALDVLPGSTLAFAQGPLLYSFEEFKLAPRGADDYDATLVACAKAAMPASIFEVQQGMVPEDELVVFENVVVTTPLTFAGDAFWMQDPAGGQESGVSVFVLDPEGLNIGPGDEITLCGAYSEYFDQTQIVVASAADINVTGTVPVPAPEVLTSDEAATEPWEGVLAQIDGPIVTAEANMFGEWQIDDVLLVTDIFFAQGDWPTPATDTSYTSLTGVIEYSFGNFKLAPRDEADIVE